MLTLVLAPGQVVLEAWSDDNLHVHNISVLLLGVGHEAMAAELGTAHAAGSLPPPLLRSLGLWMQQMQLHTRSIRVQQSTPPEVGTAAASDGGGSGHSSGTNVTTTSSSSSSNTRGNSVTTTITATVSANGATTTSIRSTIGCSCCCCVSKQCSTGSKGKGSFPGGAAVSPWVSHTGCWVLDYAVSRGWCATAAVVLKDLLGSPEGCGLAFKDVCRSQDGSGKTLLVRDTRL